MTIAALGEMRLWRNCQLPVLAGDYRRTGAVQNSFNKPHLGIGRKNPNLAHLRMIYDTTQLLNTDKQHGLFMQYYRQD